MRLLAGLVCAVLLLLPVPLLGQADKSFLPAHLKSITASSVAGLQEVGQIGSGSIDQISLSPDGRYLAVINRFGIFIHDLEHAEQPPRVLAAEYQPIINARFSPSWAQVVVSGTQMVVMDVATGKTSQVLMPDFGTHSTANEIVFSHSGHYVAVSMGYDGGVIMVWDLHTPGMVYTQEHRYMVGSPLFSQHDRIFTYAYYEIDAMANFQNMSYWYPADTTHWEDGWLDSAPFDGFFISNAEKPPFDENTRHIDSSADGSILVSIDRDDMAHVWDGLTARELRPLSAGTAFERFNPSGALLVYNVADHTLRLHSAMTGLEQTIATAAPDHYTDFSADGKTLVIVEGSRARLLNLETKTERSVQLGNYLGFISDMAFSKDGQTLYFLANAKSLWQLDMANGILTPIGEQEGLSGAFAFNPATSMLALGGNDGSIYLWNVQTKKQVAGLRENQQRIDALVFSGDGHTLASSSEDNTVRLWDVESGTSTLFNRYDKGPIGAIAFSPDSKILAALGTNYDAGVVFYHVPQSRSFAKIVTNGFPFGGKIVFSQTGRWVVYGGSGLQLMPTSELSNVEPKPLQLLDYDRVVAISFNPASDLVFNSNTDTYIGIVNSFQAWNVDTQTSILQKDLPVAPYTALTFSPDGRVMAAAGYEGVIHFWGVPAS